MRDRMQEARDLLAATEGFTDGTADYMRDLLAWAVDEVRRLRVAESLLADVREAAWSRGSRVGSR